MANDNALKSAYQLAMERLQKKDADAGVTSVPLTDEQKAAIAEVRSFYDAKIAQEDVLHQSKLRSVFEAEEREEISRQFRREREHLAAERDAKIDKIRRGGE